MPTARSSRPLALTGLLYALLLAVVAVDVWGVFFWARVGGGIGLVLAVVGVVVAVALLGILGRDVVRQRSARRTTAAPTAGEAPR